MVIKWGFIKTSNCPLCLRIDNGCMIVIKIRFKLHTYIISNKQGENCGMQPIKLYKHATQMCYNTGNAGLDKNTELSLQV